MQPEQFVPTTLDKIDLDPGIFRAYDIRGITRSNLTDDVLFTTTRSPFLNSSKRFLVNLLVK